MNYEYYETLIVISLKFLKLDSYFIKLLNYKIINQNWLIGFAKTKNLVSNHIMHEEDEGWYDTDSILYNFTSILSAIQMLSPERLFWCSDQ